MKKIILITIAIVFISSCKKEEKAPEAKSSKSLISFFTTSNTIAHGNFTFGSIRYGFGTSIEPVYLVGGDFFSTTAHEDEDRVNVGNISFGDNTLSPSNNIYAFGESDVINADNSDLFDNEITFSASGNGTFGVPTFTLYQDAPKELVVTASNIIGGEINTLEEGDDIALEWNEDTENPDGKIYIILTYDRGISNALDSDNEDSTPDPIIIETDHDGAYTLSTNILPAIEHLQCWTITIGRFNNEIVSPNSKDYEFSTYTAVSQMFQIQ